MMIPFDRFSAQPVAWLVDGHVVLCDACCHPSVLLVAPSVARLHAVDIGSYRQSCHGCSVVISPGAPCGSSPGICNREAEGVHTHWPELYDAPKDEEGR